MATTNTYQGKIFIWLKSFTGGFVSTLLFHQGLVALLYVTNIIPRAPFNMQPTEPFGVPSVISLAFFGGLWGVLIWHFIAHLAPKPRLFHSLIWGAIGPTAIAFLVVFPLKGIELNPMIIPIGLFLNAVWGLGLYLFMLIDFRKEK